MQTWEEVIELEKQKDYYKSLKEQIEKKYETSTVFPPHDKIFNAFSKTPIENLKVVILGQDPYHGLGQAQGFSFSTPKDVKNPPSMQNILKEIKDDLQRDSNCLDGDLTPWAKDGVLLLNTILTVEEGKPKSHHKLGWEIFTDNIIKYISEQCENIVFILWGAPSIKKNKLIDSSRHYILEAPHPSPLSSYRGFLDANILVKQMSFYNQLVKNQLIGKE